MDIQEVLKNKDMIYSEKMEKGANKFLDFGVNVFKSQEAKKADGQSGKSISIDVVANTPYFFDSDGDVVLPNAFEFDGLEFPELDSHNRSTIASLITWGKFNYGKVLLSALGIAGTGEVDTLLFKAQITPDQHSLAYSKYKSGLIRQHSLAFRYVDLKFACNEDGDQWIEERKLWDEVYPLILNKEDVDNAGYFWVVAKGTIREVSACVFGASRLTPTLSVEESNKSENQKTTIFTYKN